MNIQKIVKIVALVIGLIAVFFLVRIMMLGDEAIKTIPENQGILSGFANLAYVVLAITAITAIVFSLVNLVSHPDKLKKALMSLGVFALVLVVAWFASSGQERLLSDGTTLTAGQSQMIEAGIKAFYILILLAAGLMLFFGAKKMLSK
ncbi:hypothetical protein ES692_07605 [Psychroserpens burtonensis]|uniref:Uncharacterized protein n=1 Tax=Psychroserpens burtonensis TaxID=49278 RepID=A0A5C7BH69_9FLAO|nr:hypothetical protein [Psychroserpens burtonensis]TXE18102.1 hypothetical protein ES692_07605 [Psychroserpens burtonensis]